MRSANFSLWADGIHIFESRSTKSTWKQAIFLPPHNYPGSDEIVDFHVEFRGFSSGFQVVLSWFFEHTYVKSFWDICCAISANIDPP